MATGNATAGVEDLSSSNDNFPEKSSMKDEGRVELDLIQDAASKEPLCASEELGSLRSEREHNNVDPPNIHYPQLQAVYFGGYGNAAEWDEYSHYPTPDLLDLGSPVTGIYNENQSLVFPAGYGYNVQMPFGPFSPVSPSPPSARGDGPMYSTPQFSFTGPYFHQSIPPSMPYLNSPTILSQADSTMPVAVEHHGAFTDVSNPNGFVFGQSTNYPSYGSFGRSNFSGNSDGQMSLNSVSPTPLAAAFGNSITPFPSGQAFQQQRPSHGFGSLAGSYSTRNMHGGYYNLNTGYGSNFGVNGRGWIGTDKGRHPVKQTAQVCSCNGSADFLVEQNRGPRSRRQKNLAAEENSPLDSQNNHPSTLVDWMLYNKPDFVTEYKDAKFFIIKSYSEDNIHKSIKYGVWTSTPNGNRKLDAAFREAREEGDACPVFLFFSVNASAQFCGVAEMVGPVDFDKSMDYWQQNKWCGHFPVKWHIVKDVPNSLLRHIILENNDNKPVTNSRDTQEVKVEQGLEMLYIFKKHEADMSILDDFEFYETRQKAMQERKAWRQNQPHPFEAFPMTSPADVHHPSPLNLNCVNQMSKTFAQVVRLDESRKEDAPTSDFSSTQHKDLANSETTVAA